MRTLEKRQTRTWLAAAAADPYRKLASIALAIVLWFLLNHQINDTKMLTMRLVVVDPQRTTRPNVHQVSVELPLDLVVGRRFFDADKVIDSVTVVLRGPRGRIETIDKGPNSIDLQVKGLLANDRTNPADTTSTEFVEFTVADIQRTLELTDSDITIELIPARIRLEVESIRSHPVELSPAVVDLHVDEELGKRLRLDTATFSHARAHILGPASSIEVFKSRPPGTKPLQAWIKGAASERQITTILELTAAPELGLRLKETPSMTIPMLPYTEMFELEVPLRVDDLALPAALQGHYRPDPDARTKVVRIRAGGRLLAHLTFLRDDPDKNKLRTWALENLRLNIWIAPIEPDTTPPADFQCTAVLVLQGLLRPAVERNECELAQTELFRLRRIP